MGVALPLRKQIFKSSDKSAENSVGGGIVFSADSAGITASAAWKRVEMGPLHSGAGNQLQRVTDLRAKAETMT